MAIRGAASNSSNFRSARDELEVPQTGISGDDGEPLGRTLREAFGAPGTPGSCDQVP